MKDFLNKYMNKENLEKIVDWCKKNRRFFVAAALFIVLIVVLRSCTGSAKNADKDSPDTEEDVLDAAFETDANEAVNSLIASYFAAYANADMDTLMTLATPISENEQSYIRVFAQYIESYENITCYTKAGLTEDSYLVSAYFELKFAGVETAAPGLDFFYVETAEDGSVYINNLYSSYNLNRTENDLDPSIYALILRYEQKEDSIALRESVEQSYEEALSGDVELASMISATIPDAMAEWMNSISQSQTDEGQEGTEVSTEETTETPSEEGTEDATGTDGKTPAEGTDDAAGTDGKTPAEDTGDAAGADDGNAAEGTDDAAGTDGETPAEDTGDAAGTDDGNAADGADDGQTTDNTDTEKKVVKVKINVDKLKIRVEPNTSCDVLGKAMKGETYVELDDLGDWFKISYNGQTGYVKAEYVTEVKE